VTLVVFGAGAVGSLLAARLTATGRPVRLVGRPEHVAAIRSDGLRVEGVGAGTFRCEAVSDLGTPSDVEVVLLTVKTFNLADAAAAIGRSIGPVPVLLTQNGLGIEPRVVAALRGAGWEDADHEVVRAVHSLPATWVGPGVVRAAGSGEVALPDLEHHPALSVPIRRFLDLFRGAGIPVRTVADLEREIWKKVLVNAAVNPVTAVHRVRNGELRSGPLRVDAEHLLQEAITVAHAAGVPIPVEEATGELDRIVRATAENRSSMLQDVERGRPTEVDAISGELVRRGAAGGIDLPFTREYIARLRSAAAP